MEMVLRMTLLNDGLLERSAVVANCRMNRERNLTGSNGYTKEIGFNPIERLIERSGSGRIASWLDMCCGKGHALIQAARRRTLSGWAPRYKSSGSISSALLSARTPS